MDNSEFYADYDLRFRTSFCNHAHMQKSDGDVGGPCMWWFDRFNGLYALTHQSYSLNLNREVPEII